jgi:hypothetical protein
MTTLRMPGASFFVLTATGQSGCCAMIRDGARVPPPIFGGLGNERHPTGEALHRV